jgi:hypothetical protein
MSKYTRCDRCRRSTEEHSLTFEYVMRYVTVPRPTVIEDGYDEVDWPPPLWQTELCNDCIKQLISWVEDGQIVFVKDL